MDKQQIVGWLLEGDVSIQFQVHLDLFGNERKDLQNKIANEGWGKRFLLKRNSNLIQFNTPKNRFGIGVGNRELAKNLGFNMNYRYQESFFWQSLFGETTIPAYGVLDAQVNYKLSFLKTILKIGGTNLGGKDYRTSFGSPYVGQIYYVSLVFDDLLR